MPPLRSQPMAVAISTSSSSSSSSSDEAIATPIFTVTVPSDPTSTADDKVSTATQVITITGSAAPGSTPSSSSSSSTDSTFPTGIFTITTEPASMTTTATASPSPPSSFTTVVGTPPTPSSTTDTTSNDHIDTNGEPNGEIIGLAVGLGVLGGLLLILCGRRAHKKINNKQQDFHVFVSTQTRKWWQFWKNPKTAIHNSSSLLVVWDRSPERGDGHTNNSTGGALPNAMRTTIPATVSRSKTKKDWWKRKSPKQTEDPIARENLKATIRHLGPLSEESSTTAGEQVPAVVYGSRAAQAYTPCQQSTTISEDDDGEDFGFCNVDLSSAEGGPPQLHSPGFMPGAATQGNKNRPLSYAASSRYSADDNGEASWLGGGGIPSYYANTGTTQQH